MPTGQVKPWSFPMPQTPTDRSRLLRLAAALPKGDPKRRAILAGLRQAAYPREGTAVIANLNDRGFRLYYKITRNPLGLAAEKMPDLGKTARESMNKFVTRLGAGIGIPLSVAGEGTYVLLDIEKDSIVFKVDAQIKNNSRNALTEQTILDAEKTVFDRFGYQVMFL
jgi:hypothetical protein